MFLENKPFEIIWDGQLLELDVLGIVKGTKRLEQARQFVAFATDTQRLADPRIFGLADKQEMTPGHVFQPAAALEKLLAQPRGWLVYNLHGLDEEGWGPISPAYLERLLGRLRAIESVRILPTGRALLQARGSRI